MNHKSYVHNLCIHLKILNYVHRHDPNLTSPSGRNQKFKQKNILKCYSYMYYVQPISHTYLCTHRARGINSQVARRIIEPHVHIASCPVARCTTDASFVVKLFKVQTTYNFTNTFTLT